MRQKVPAICFASADVLFEIKRCCGNEVLIIAEHRAEMKETRRCDIDETCVPIKMKSSNPLLLLRHFSLRAPSPTACATKKIKDCCFSRSTVLSKLNLFCVHPAALYPSALYPIALYTYPQPAAPQQNCTKKKNTPRFTEHALLLPPPASPKSPFPLHNTAMHHPLPLHTWAPWHH